jgi:hypothetical protein
MRCGQRPRSRDRRFAEQLRREGGVLAREQQTKRERGMVARGPRALDRGVRERPHRLREGDAVLPSRAVERVGGSVATQRVVEPRGQGGLHLFGPCGVGAKAEGHDHERPPLGPRLLEPTPAADPRSLSRDASVASPRVSTTKLLQANAHAREEVHRARSYPGLHPLLPRERSLLQHQLDAILFLGAAPARWSRRTR